MLGRCFMFDAIRGAPCDQVGTLALAGTRTLTSFSNANYLLTGRYSELAVAPIADCGEYDTGSLQRERCTRSRLGPVVTVERRWHRLDDSQC